ncbi:hypothetical protein NM688_g3177 [Phlebia brevispora]|uniref:Uncharacterized protein n=1 Tax=Phlebia brevispora TaxID=194682 RepID=A0ACC1T6L8_9APHY|nr:hypothetical protein NM688_g3177 [Phlebia brevispora]
MLVLEEYADGDRPPEWEAKYHKIIDSLRRNIDYFYLQADQLGKRPPRIHRIASIWQKLWNFLSKFESIERGLEVFHEHIRALEIRAQLRGMKAAAEQELEAERGRRAVFKAAAAQARAQRKEMRAEMRRQYELARSARGRRRPTNVPRLP